jgi:hypothetical protein
MFSYEDFWILTQLCEDLLVLYFTGNFQLSGYVTKQNLWQ